MKKGYIYVILFSLFVAVTQSLKYRLFVKKDFGERTMQNLIIQAIMLFLIVLIPSLLTVRWYYKQKNKS